VETGLAAILQGMKPPLTEFKNTSNKEMGYSSLGGMLSTTLKSNPLGGLGPLKPAVLGNKLPSKGK